MSDASIIGKPNPGSVTFHWVGTILVFLALLAGLYVVYYSSGCCAADRRTAYLLHAYAGLAVLGLVVLRLMFRARYSWPDSEHYSGAGVGFFVAKIIHWALYGMMILIPLTGWIMASGMGCCWSVPGLPNVIMLSLGLSDIAPSDIGAAYRVHVTLAWLIIGLIALHVLASLFHQFYLKNDILRRMLPGRMPRKGNKNGGPSTAGSVIMNKENA